MSQNETNGGKSDGCIDHTDKDTLRELYHGRGLTTQEVADMSKVSETQIRYWMDKFGIERRDVGPEKGSQHVNYAHFGTTANGYESWATWDYEKGELDRVKVHRLLAVAEYGYEAVVDKDIHHRNGVKWDNRPENVEPLTRSEHMSLHASE